MSDHWEVHALKYARLDWRTSANFIDGDAHDRPMPLDYFVGVVRNGTRSFVVDTGFGAAAAEGRNRTILRPVGVALMMGRVRPIGLRRRRNRTR